MEADYFKEEREARTRKEQIKRILELLVMFGSGVVTGYFLHTH